MKNIIFIIFLLFLFCKETRLKKRTFYRMDTVVQVTLVPGNIYCDKNKCVFSSLLNRFIFRRNSNSIQSTWDKIDSLLSGFEVRFSLSHPESEVLLLNSRKDSVVKVSPILYEMIETGLRYGDTLKGNFDITILPVKKLWGFCDNGKGEKRIPSSEELKDAVSRIGYRKVKIDSVKKTVAFDNFDIKIDVGGVAKGFALRELGKLLDIIGCKNYLVVAGGDIISKGKKPDSSSWKIGIQHPRKDDKLIGALFLDTGSVVTSGDYERFWIKNGKRYHHIFNPSTGIPCELNQSLTVWAENPVIADILSTGLFCMPKDSILAFVDNRDLLECVVVDSAGNVAVSEGWKDKIALFKNN